MNYKCGIIGLPNVGKSTLFNLITQSNANTDNYLFCTIKPNIATAQIFDLRLLKIKKIIKPKKIKFSNITFIDIAGLIKGASKGDGLGNQFLSNIRNVHTIIHVVRCFIDEKIIHYNNIINPINDIEIINMELIFSDINTIDNALNKIKNINNKETFFQKNTLEKIKKYLNAGFPIRNLKLNFQEKKIIHNLYLLTYKPIIYIANLSNKDHFKNKNHDFLKKIIEFAKTENTICIPIDIQTQFKLENSNKNNKNEIIINNKKKSISNKDNIIHAVYKSLELCTYYTINKKEAHAWIIKKQNTAIQAAKNVHSDFKKGFIRVEIISYIDLITYKDYKIIKSIGKLKIEGKCYTIQDGDIVYFHYNI
ncbi:redox-regulated ATPase YchF [Candidatus Legionella polyplacis]|uniref:redox-regulated ATPase YchF n=1 Tax=Candidatus Legionella polyplacis TaxID=2005262 RepID=UPI000C1E2B11|nr:redox-regulated ATPase YchF [Candidatus Legionella polyplacis]ATW01637.1 redox-regulated ATPase YchF [Candidatus Legionella polyplacis]